MDELLSARMSSAVTVVCGCVGGTGVGLGFPVKYTKPPHGPVRIKHSTPRPSKGVKAYNAAATGPTCYQNVSVGSVCPMLTAESET